MAEPKLYRPNLSVGLAEPALLWLPDGAGGFSKQPIHVDYLPSSAIYVSSENKFPLLRDILRGLPLDDFLVRYSWFIWTSAARRDDFLKSLENRGWDYHTDFREYQMAFVIRTLLMDYDLPGERRWKAGQERLPEYFHYLTKLGSHSFAPVDLAKQKNAHAMLLRISYQQWGDFEELSRLYSRAFLLYEDCSLEPARKQGINLADVFLEKTGLSIRQAQAVAFAIYSIFWRGRIGPHFDDTFLASPNAHFPGLSADLMTAFRGWLAADFAEYRAMCEAPTQNLGDGYDVYSLNPLIRTPILSLPSGQFVIPSPRMLFRRVTAGLFYDLIDSPLQDRVGNVIGRAIELYTRMLVDELPSHHVIHPEQEYKPGQSTSEWIVEEPDAVLIIENKRRSLRQKAKTTGEEADILDDISTSNSVLDGIKKLIETHAALRRGEITGVQQGRPAIALLITLDHFYLANAPYIRNIIERALARDGFALDGLDLQICSIPDFEDLCWLAHATREPLTRILGRKLQSPQGAEQDVGVWVRNVWPRGKGAHIPSHERAWHQNFAEVVQSIRGDLPPLNPADWNMEPDSAA